MRSGWFITSALPEEAWRRQRRRNSLLEVRVLHRPLPQGDFLLHVIVWAAIITINHKISFRYQLVRTETIGKLSFERRSSHERAESTAVLRGMVAGGIPGRANCR